MIRITLLFVILLTAFSCKRQDKFTISGELEGIENEKVYLLKFIDGERRPVDSVYMDGNKFSFTGSVDVPQFYHIGFEERVLTIEIFMENSDIEVISSRRNLSEARVTGSSVHDEYNRFRLQLINVELDINDVVNDMEYLRRWGHYEEAERMKVELHEPLLEERLEFLQEFVKANNSSHVGAFVLYFHLMYELDTEELENMLGGFDHTVAESPYLKAVEWELEKRERVAPGNPLIDFTLEDSEGNPVSLSSFAGNGYLILDFTASWSDSCREALPGLQKVYSEFSDRGLDVVSVSLENNREDWLEFIKQEGQDWNYLTDMKQWNSPAAEAYLVRSIPHWVLIDPEGKIVYNGLDSVEKLYDELKRLL